MLVSDGVSLRKGNESKQLFGVIKGDDLGVCVDACAFMFSHMIKRYL